MWQFIGIALVALVAVYGVQTYSAFRKNLAAAKASGLPYIISPIYTFNPFWLLSHEFFLPLLRLVPERHRPAFTQYVKRAS